MTDVRDKNIIVIGAAKSGVAVARLLKEHGANVFVTDSGNISGENKETLSNSGIGFEEGGHSEQCRIADLAIVSPGVPDEAPLVQYYLNAEREVHSEIEIASWFSKKPIVAVTGSNGKTTVTSWLGHLWKSAGLSADVGGNIGVAYSDLVRSKNNTDWSILEVSSFQLDHISTFRPKISCLLNITPDHLNRYQYKFENYAKSKMRIGMNQKDSDVFISWNEDPITNGLLYSTFNREDKPRIWKFSSTSEVTDGIFVRNDEIFFNTDKQEEYLMHIEEIGLKGRHNLHNGLATALAARAAEIRIESIRDSLMKFEGVEHRLEFVRKLDGVQFVNDSKATNVNAVWYALESFKMPVVLILGGRDKGNDYAELVEQIHQKVHTIVAIGEGKQAIKDQLSEHVPYLIEADSMEEAVSV
ncbi:MAG TPA: UDP-N-acetylmuramoyl-L-alanine--D-glutamate ligase, partial [Bacteroidetes bacterium]|nr:UDP-N-acetylmuramoyl-L-alanine--D-glutamate ligase [Bacteroidota bacterium]